MFDYDRDAILVHETNLAKDPIVKRYLFCSNSYKRTCNAFICMNIPVQEVFDAVTRRLES